MFYWLWKCKSNTLINNHFITKYNVHGMVTRHSRRIVPWYSTTSQFFNVTFYTLLHFGYRYKEVNATLNNHVEWLRWPKNISRSCRGQRKSCCQLAILGKVSKPWWVCPWCWLWNNDSGKRPLHRRPTDLKPLDFKFHVVLPNVFAVFALLPAVAILAVPDVVPAVQQHGATGGPHLHLQPQPFLVFGKGNQYGGYFLGKKRFKLKNWLCQSNINIEIWTTNRKYLNIHANSDKIKIV